jgi:dTDP-glucose 4,6-dehydratase
MDTAKIRAELGWEPRETLATGMKRTVRWYLDNPGWIDGVRTGEYRKWMETNYSGRTAR